MVNKTCSPFDKTRDCKLNFDLQEREVEGSRGPQLLHLCNDEFTHRIFVMYKEELSQVTGGLIWEHWLNRQPSKNRHFDIHRQIRETLLSS